MGSPVALCKLGRGTGTVAARRVKLRLTSSLGQATCWCQGGSRSAGLSGESSTGGIFIGPGNVLVLRPRPWRRVVRGVKVSEKGKERFCALGAVLQKVNLTFSGTGKKVVLWSSCSTWRQSSHTPGNMAGLVGQQQR
eukprot:scaffold53049_cov23-Tisochrysis_lutea.AAC.1